MSNFDLTEAVAEAIALWDYLLANRGEQPDSDESLVLPPHREVAQIVVPMVERQLRDRAGKIQAAADHEDNPAVADALVWAARIARGES